MQYISITLLLTLASLGVHIAEGTSPKRDVKVIARTDKKSSESCGQEIYYHIVFEVLKNGLCSKVFAMFLSFCYS